jgi:hypothetical protein
MSHRFALLCCLGLVCAFSVSAFGAAGAGLGQAHPREFQVTLAVRVAPPGGARIVATGRVKPAPAIARVELEFRRRGAWGVLAGGRLRHGGFKIPSYARRDGRLVLRAQVWQGKRRLGVSPIRSVRIKRRAVGPPPLRPSPPPPTNQPPPGPAEEPLSAASLMATVEGYSRLPNHLSGTPNSAAALAEFQANLAAAGLRLGEEAFTFPRFAVDAVGLRAGPATVSAAAIVPLLYSGTTPANGVEAPLFDGGGGTFAKGEVGGKIVVVSIAYEHNSKPIGLDQAIETAVEGHAAGLVAVTQVVGDYPKWEDVNARDGTGPLPVLMVGKRSGAAVIAAAEAGESGTLTLAAETSGVSCDRDVWGELEGADPSRRVFVGTPASSYTPSASEHGTGVAITVGLARHYAALPRSQRPETLVFMAFGGHEVGWLALQSLLASPYGSWFHGADAYVHLGSALGAPAAHEEPDGSIVTSSTPDPTGRLHDSENPLLERSVIEDFEAAGVPTPETPPHIASGGEQTNAYAAGIPTASFSGASLFFHTAGDLPGTVSPGILAADADAFRRVLDTITAIPAGVLKADNAHAEELGSEIDAAARAPVNPTLGAGGTLGSGGIGGPTATPVAHCP